MIDDGAETVGVRLAVHDLAAQRLVDLDCREGQPFQEGRLQRFFLRAMARSMLRGWTDTPSSTSMRRASALACI